MNTKRIAIIVLAVAVGGLLAGCGGTQDDLTTSTSTTAPTTSVATTPNTITSSTPDQAAAEASEAARVAAEQEAARVAEQEAARVAAESSAADQSAADQASADAAASSEAQAQVVETTATSEHPAEWIDPDGNWMSPSSIQNALDAGIPWGDFITGALRCGTICGEVPTSGEVQMVNGCKDGYIPASECAAQGLLGGGPEREPASAPTTNGDYITNDPSCGYMIVRSVCYEEPWD